ncbi:hypothetical protein [Vibrio phage YC]|uniref:Uncharacterized protein n=1 Tax=Vibrio phage YC TaxID=2267403 RepID=A0A384ZS19_9CAUD|nr:hypothetical protein HWB64_gp083 [Vibrio phage YC]AXC34452.1 hypothetical protein [Vibrio phage YC]
MPNENVVAFTKKKHPWQTGIDEILAQKPIQPSRISFVIEGILVTEFSHRDNNALVRGEIIERTKEIIDYTCQQLESLGELSIMNMLESIRDDPLSGF